MIYMETFIKFFSYVYDMFGNVKKRLWKDGFALMGYELGTFRSIDRRATRLHQRALSGTVANRCYEDEKARLWFATNVFNYLLQFEYIKPSIIKHPQNKLI